MSESIGVAPIVDMRNISKAFGAVQALRDVDLQLYPGEILGLVGDNSAGKSTLMKSDVLTSGSGEPGCRRPTISAAP